MKEVTFDVKYNKLGGDFLNETELTIRTDLDGYKDKMISIELNGEIYLVDSNKLKEALDLITK